MRQLLDHTSGLPDHLGVLVPDAAAVRTGGGTRCTPQQLLAAAQAQPWVSDPGTAFVCSNTGCTVLGLVVEATTGRPVAQEVTERVIEPLGLASTSWPEDAGMPAGSLAGHLDEGGRRTDVTAWDPSVWFAGAAVVSTASDVSTFVEALGAEPVELVLGQRGNGFGYRTISPASPDGDRVATIAWTASACSAAEDTLVEPGGAALVRLLAATCP